MRSARRWFTMAVLGSAHLRSTLYIMLLLNCAPAAAAMTCDQLGNIALATEQYRNQGEPLQVLLSEADKLGDDDKLTKPDLERIKKTIQDTYDRTRTALEVRKECKDVPVK
ncbi:MAG: hypothetical protein JWN94_887 [Betaproteobacteria bacterium]|nr:hypothetical protein [Betaproteobacteria bacterium]